ncbi:MAG: hypothetical protein QW112_02960 [Candidatus Micrarchaeia archaeon]
MMIARTGRRKGNLRKPRIINNKQIKALGLFSGGLDSIIAAKLMKDMGFNVELIFFTSPFLNRTKAIDESLERKVRMSAKQLGLRVNIIPIGAEYIDIIRNAKYGYGKGMNPCIDCKIYMLRKAWEYTEHMGFKFLFTGDVLGERPLSQTRHALEIIDKELGLEGKIVRPLSGKLLPATEAEIKGWLNRNKLLAISGRSRHVQMSLARKWNLTYPAPAGGCLLTDKHYSLRLKDLFEHAEETRKYKIDFDDIAVLSIGRHFRFGNSKIIIGRREDENIQLRKMAHKEDLILECDEVMGPTTLLRGIKNKKTICLAARLTAYFSDARKEGITRVRVNIWKANEKSRVNKFAGDSWRINKTISISPRLDFKKEMDKGLVWIGQNVWSN